MRWLVSRAHLPNTLKVIGTETAEKVFIIFFFAQGISFDSLVPFTELNVLDG